MNRVWKKFLMKVAKSFGLIFYLLGSMMIPGVAFLYLGYDPELGVLAGLMLFVVIPMLVYIIRAMYKDAKYEVETENKQMMRALKGDRY